MDGIVKLFLLALLLETARAGGSFTFNVVSYTNHKGQDHTKSSCDSFSACDFYFHITYHIQGTTYAAINTKVYENQNTVNFGNAYSRHHRFIKWLGTFGIHVGVKDSDSGSSDDVVDQITSSFAITPDGKTHSKRANGIHGANAYLDYTIKVSCDSNFHPPTCETYCATKNYGVCRYWCDGKGNRVCYEGWKNPAGGCCDCYCHNGGTCRKTADNFTCDCPAGWTGFMCKDDVNECSGTPCLNGGACTNTVGSYKCTCKPGFRGSRCENDINECAETTALCKNSGTCVNTVGSYRCDCKPGYTGKYCTEDVNECAESTPVCKNSGSCTNSPGSFKCSCTSSFTGTTCEDKVCKPKGVGQCQYTCLSNGDKQCREGWKNPAGGCCDCYCLNGGTCRKTADDFVCDCPAGWTGFMCKDDVNECSASPPACKNGGKCTNSIGSFTCSCASGFKGRTCEDDINECATRPPACKNNGSCTNTRGSFKCSCPSGFSGRTCEDDVNECAASPPACKNNGSCTNSHGSFACRCRSGLSGKTCEQDVDECGIAPPICRNGGTCDNQFGNYSCNCTRGFSGRVCEFGTGSPVDQTWKYMVTGIVVGCLLLLIGVLVFFLLRRASHKRRQRPYDIGEENEYGEDPIESNGIGEENEYGEDPTEETYDDLYARPDRDEPPEAAGEDDGAKVSRCPEEHEEGPQLPPRQSTGNQYAELGEKAEEDEDEDEESPPDVSVV